MAFTTNPYCTLQQVKNALDLQKTSQDAWIQELIEEAQSTLDREIGYSFQTDGTTQSPATRYYDGTGENELFIDFCISISQVLETSYDVLLDSFGVYQVADIVTTDITTDCYLLPNNAGARNEPYYKIRRLSGYESNPGHRNYIIKGVF